MTQYFNVKVNISEGQFEKIKKAAKEDTAVSIKLSHEDLSGEHILALTQAQINRMKKAYENGRGVTLKLSKTQLAYNMSVEGGFLPALIGALATAAPFLVKTVLPTIAKAVLPAVASTAISKLTQGSSYKGAALYIKKGDYSGKVMKVGQGLYLAPWKKSDSVSASGLYMKTGKGVYTSGEGLILGPDSPFKNIPILGLLL
jgi:hypothetical protein